MNLTNKVLTVVALIAIGASVLIQPAFAFTLNPNAVQTRCENVTGKINSIVTRYDANKNKHIERYQDIATRIQTLISKLEGKGYDLTKLKTDLAKLNVLRNEFVTEYASFIAHLRKAQTFVCGNSEGQFKAEVELARADLGKARNKAEEIRTFVQNVIKPDLQDIRNQVKNKQ